MLGCNLCLPQLDCDSLPAATTSAYADIICAYRCTHADLSKIVRLCCNWFSFPKLRINSLKDMLLRSPQPRPVPLIVSFLYYNNHYYSQLDLFIHLSNIHWAPTTCQVLFVVHTGDKMNTAKSRQASSTPGLALRFSPQTHNHPIAVSLVQLQEWPLTDEVTPAQGHLGKRTKTAHGSVCLCLSPEKSQIPMHGPEVPFRRHSSTSNIIYLPKLSPTLCKTGTVKPTK